LFERDDYLNSNVETPTVNVTTLNAQMTDGLSWCELPMLAVHGSTTSRASRTWVIQTLVVDLRLKEARVNVMKIGMFLVHWH